MPLLRLTGLLGDMVLVSGEDFIIHRATAGAAASRDCTLIKSAAGEVCVKETVEEVALLIESSR
jgi:hypothetical protein